MGSLPRLTYTKPYALADIEVATLGTVEVGRVSPRGYLFIMRRWYQSWKPTKSLLAAKNGLERELTDLLRDMGLLNEPGEARSPDGQPLSRGAIPPATGSSARQGQVDLRQPLPAPPDFPDATGQQEG
jgi:hypothetical protein